VNGRVKKCDTVRLAWRRIDCPAKINLKHLRKTSATLLGGNREFASVADLYLGHAPRSIADKHYKQAPMELLAYGVLWLGEQFGVCRSNDADSQSQPTPHKPK
jgi:intergrase/recombinase